jgi:transposase
MRRVIGMDIHRTFAQVVFWEHGKLRSGGRVSMTRSGLEGFGRSLGKERGTMATFSKQWLAAAVIA